MSENEHSHPHTHQSHEAIIKRLKRAEAIYAASSP